MGYAVALNLSEQNWRKTVSARLYQEGIDPTVYPYNCPTDGSDGGAGLQAALTAAVAAGVPLLLPALPIFSSIALTVNQTGSVVILGRGPLSGVVFTSANAAAGFDFTLRAYDAGTGAIDRLWLADFFIGAQAVHTVPAIKVVMTAHTASAETALHINHVQVRPYGVFGTNKFDKGFHGSKIFDGLIERFTFIGATSKSTAGIYLNNCINVNIENAEITYCTTAVHVTTGDGGVAQEQSEGFHIQDGIFYNVTNGVVADGLSSGAFNALDIRVSDTHVAADQQAINFDLVLQSEVTDNVFYTNTSTQSGIIDLDGFGNIYSGNQIIQAVSAGAGSVGIDIQGTGQAHTITGNFVATYEKGLKFGASTQSNSHGLNTLIANTTAISDAGTNNQDFTNSVLAAGGGFTQLTGLGAPWTQYTPTVTVGSGSITTLGTCAGYYVRLGKLIHIKVLVSVTTNGTAGTSINASLPLASANNGVDQVLAGIESTGNGLNGWVQANTSVVYLRRYDGTYHFADGTTYQVSGTYEAA